MPRVTTIQTNFSGGELSPRMLGRVELPIYQSCAEIIENAVPVVQGGCIRRYGTTQIQSAKGLNNTRLIPFVLDGNNAYVLEVGNFYIRFFKNNAQIQVSPGVPVEIATPYSQAIAFELYYCQGADTMMFFHQSFPIQRLRRFSDQLWVFDAAPIDPMPFDEIGDSFATTLTLSAASVGAGRTATTGAGTFLNSDVGRTLAYQGGYATITGFTNATVVTVTINTAFQSTAIPASVWTLGGTPQSGITPSAKDPVGTIITLISTGLDTWRSSDVGKYVNIAGGLVKITTYTSTLQVSARIIEPLLAVVAQPALAWVLNAAVWGGGNGYPRCGTFYQQRLCAAGTPAQPQTVWGSSSGAYFDFTMGPLDADAFAYTIASDESNPILALSATSILVALTLSREFTIKGGVEKPITPTNVQVDSDTNYGSGAVRPVRFGKNVGFVQRAGRKLRVFSYDKIYNLSDAPDITFLSEHVSKQPGAALYGFTELAYAAEPDPIVWCKRADGVLASLTTSDATNVNAWARQFTAGGTVESVATIPMAGGDQTWLLVKRTVNGAPVKYLEVYDSSVATDCSKSMTSVGPQTTWAGLDHLEGLLVQAYSLNADGSGLDFGDFTVSGGAITIPHAVTALQVGLGFNSKIKMLTPEIATGTGSAQGNAMRTSEVTVRVKDTAALLCNGQEFLPKGFGSSLLDASTPAYTGLKRVENLDFERGVSDITFTQSRPFPFHILAVIRKLTVND